MANQLNFRNSQGLRHSIYTRSSLACLHSFTALHLKTMHQTNFSNHHALISRLASLFRSQPHANEEIELTQHPNRLRVVEVAAVRDRQALVVARGPQFEKAKRAHEQARLHAQYQASSSHTQPADASTSTTHPTPMTTAAQPPPISWWAQIVLFLCCAYPPHTNGHQHG
ncbi:hypothetical protein EDD22DRAFT_1053579 [Suillus occidentalis]|nr:hypothetical protein EDD22DRAFT_1053579 [Suillus occidentalis]